jgi:cyanophycin synthetase
VSTVAALVGRENRRRIDARGKSGLALLELDLDAVLALRAQGLTLRSVLPTGREAEVKTATSQNRADENETVRDLAAAIAEEAIAAARVVGARLAGVDVVTPDRTVPLAEAGGAILEVNTTPGFNPHYLVADRARAERVAVPILRALLGAR